MGVEKLAMLRCCAVALLLLLVLIAVLRSLLARRLLGSVEPEELSRLTIPVYQISSEYSRVHWSIFSRTRFGVL